MSTVRVPDRRAASDVTALPPAAPLVLRVPVDPEGDERGAAELLAAAVAVVADGTIQLEAAPTRDRAEVLRLVDRCQVLRDLGAPSVGWRQLGPGRVPDAILDGGRAPGTILCMALGSRHAPGSMLFSSVTDEVLRRSPVTVLVAGPHLTPPTGRFEQVVVAADGSEVAARAVAAATELAARLGAPVRTVRVVAPATEHPRPSTTPTDEGPGAVELVAAADPAGAILRAVGADPSILVIGAHKRGGPRRFALGSVALDLVRRARCPVLVVPASRPSPRA